MTACASQPAEAFTPVTLTNAAGTLVATMIAYGATTTHLAFKKDATSAPRDVLLGFDDPRQYCAHAQHPYFGATIGRVANRISRCELPYRGGTRQLSCNENNFDTLHGGAIGWDRRTWTQVSRSRSSVTWHYHSPDGEMGFPGAVDANVTFAVTDADEWTIEYTAVSDAATVLALTNHAYFNLHANLDNTPSVVDHVLSLPTADRVLEVSGAPDYHLIPTGNVLNIPPCTPLDFWSRPKTLGRDLDGGTVTRRGGLDNAFVFRGAQPPRAGVSHVATLSSPLSAIAMRMYSDQPSVQVYTSNFLNGTDPSLRIRRKASQSHGEQPQYYHWRGGVTLEAQAFPDAVHHPHFPTISLARGQRYSQRTTYAFAALANGADSVAADGDECSPPPQTSPASSGAHTVRWTPAAAHAWAARRGWQQGANFLPSTASNQFEMWQADTYDATTISRELGWARALGFTAMRVFLHDLLWRAEGAAFLDRVDAFLALAHAQNMSIMLVLFDGCWDPEPHAGVQLPPVPGVHNSRWAQAPGAAILANASRHASLEGYVRAVVRRFRNDTRVLLWDVFNEWDNGNVGSYGTSGPASFGRAELPPLLKAQGARAVLEKAIGWVRAEAPTQPLTVGVYNAPTGDAAADQYRAESASWVLEQVDVISFHEYARIDTVIERVGALQALGRPVICSEYMARGAGSTFDPVLGYMRAQGVWAFNWGLVAGRSQTNYPWGSWDRPYTSEPRPWHHDVLRVDGTPYDEAEAAYLLHPLWRAHNSTSGGAVAVAAAAAGGASLLVLCALLAIAKRRRWCVELAHGPVARRWRRALVTRGGGGTGVAAAERATVQLALEQPVADESGVKRRAGQRSPDEAAT